MAKQKHHHGVAARHVDAFECLNPKNAAYAGVDPDLKARTVEECKRIALGDAVEEHEPHAQSVNDKKTNIISQRERLMSLSSPEAMAMGNDVAIGLAERDFKGVIYAPQIDIEAHEENIGYDKFSDLHWRSVWSRHSGAFDIIVDYPAPKNDCRQANSNHPVNMEFYLDFPQICCNDRGPLISYECGERCWHDYRGPVLMDMELALGLEGNSVIHVNIHERASEECPEGYHIETDDDGNEACVADEQGECPKGYHVEKDDGGNETCVKNETKTTGTCNVGDPVTKEEITDQYKCHTAGGIWEYLID